MLFMLDYLKKSFIAYRGIKPSNIMIVNNRYLKMIYFENTKVFIDIYN